MQVKSWRSAAPRGVMSGVGAFGLALVGLLGVAPAQAAGPSPVSDVVVRPVLATFPYAPDTTWPAEDEARACFVLGSPRELPDVPPGCGGGQITLELAGIAALPGDDVEAVARVRSVYGCVDGQGRARSVMREINRVRMSGFRETGMLNYWRAYGDVARPAFMLTLDPVALACRRGEQPAQLEVEIRSLSVETWSYTEAGDRVRQAAWRVPGRWSR